MNHDTTLIEQIEQLSSDQAQEAIQLFYDLIPDSWWPDQEKMSQDDIDFQAKLIRQNATDDMKPLLKTLSGPGNTELKGEIARGLLREFASQEPLIPYLEQAVEMAREPHMSIVEIGTLLIVLAHIIPAIHFSKDKDGSWVVDIDYEEQKEQKAFSPISELIVLARIIPAIHIEHTKDGSWVVDINHKEQREQQASDKIVPPDGGSNK